MKVAFIDASVTELKKNYLGIANYCIKRQSSFLAVFVSVDSASNVVDDMEQKAYESITASGYKVVHVRSFNNKVISKWLDAEKPDILFSNAMNTYNQLWNCLCYKKGIKTLFYPHGFQIDNLYYKTTALLSKVSKILRYMYAILNTSKEINQPFLPMLSAYSKYIANGAAMVDTPMDNRLLYPSKVFVYSDYYKEFWHRKYGITEVDYEYIMPYDFLLVEPVLKKTQENAVCYITQTLYEDGRYSKAEFYNLLLTYRELAKHVEKLYVKLHPRVESTEYDKAFEGLDNVEIIREFPNCKCYITHYSSMAYLGKLISGNVIIHELPGQPTHEVYAEVASEIAYNMDDVIKATTKLMVLPDTPFEERKESISKYATYTGVSPYEVLYKSFCNL